MITGHERSSDHETFKELCALACSGALSPGEQNGLKEHLEACEDCREIYAEYLMLARDGFPLLAAHYSSSEAHKEWNDSAARRKLFARVNAVQRNGQPVPGVDGPPLIPLRRIPVNALVGAALAACFVIAIGFIAYRLGSRTPARARQLQISTESHLQNLAAEKAKAADILEARLNSQLKRSSQLQQEGSLKELELAKLRAALHAQENRAAALAASASAADAQLQAVAQERDAIKMRLAGTEKAAQDAGSQLATLHRDREHAFQRSAALESRIEDLSARNHDEEGRLRDDEQYLAYDRDIRELMGARNLYIADVFDVDSGSRTRKPYGRIFYTEGQSLIFYAFDLDRQAHVKNVSAFQAWGVIDAGKKQPLNLGVFYMDNKSNRRWVLRFNDPKQLAEINAVFVTVEPHGGSQKPTGKRFLYAWLRKEANHP